MRVLCRDSSQWGGREAQKKKATDLHCIVEYFRDMAVCVLGEPASQPNRDDCSAVRRTKQRHAAANSF